MKRATIIETRYHGPTDTKGARISAQSNEGYRGERVTLPYDHVANQESNHEAAAQRWLDRFGRKRTLCAVAETPNGRGYYFVATYGGE